MVRRYNAEGHRRPRPRSYSGATPRLSVRTIRRRTAAGSGMGAAGADFVHLGNAGPCPFKTKAEYRTDDVVRIKTGAVWDVWIGRWVDRD